MRRIEFGMHRLFAVVLIVSVCVFSAVVVATQTTGGDQLRSMLRLRSGMAPVEPTLIPGTTALPAEAEAALRAALARDGVAHALYAATAFDCEGDVCFASLAGFDELPDPNLWTLQQARAIVLVVLKRRADGSFDAAREDEPQADALLAASTSLRAQRLGNSRRLRASEAATVTESFDFPWAPGTAMLYGSLGVHRGGFIDGWKAVDLLSDGNTALGHAPNEVRAAADGAISYVCNDGVNMAVRVGSLLYVHLLPEEARLRVGEQFQRGERLGGLKAGSFRARCGYASQQTQNFHLHLAFEDAPTFTMGGWTLDTSDGVWRRRDATWRTGSWRRNDGDSASGPTPAPGPTKTTGPTRTPRNTRTPGVTHTPDPTRTATATPCPSTGLGDADCDGMVDGVDYSLWLAGSREADFDRSGVVDEADFAIWWRNRTTVTTNMLARGEDPVVQAHLVLTEVDPSRGVGGVRTFDVAIEVTFAPASPTRTLHYARVELAIPTDTLRMPAGETLRPAASGLTRVIDASTAEQIDAEGFVRLELGAQSVASAPATSQTLTLALGRFQTVRELRDVAALMLYGAQFVTSDAFSAPVTFTTLEIQPDRRLNFPVMEGGVRSATPVP